MFNLNLYRWKSKMVILGVQRRNPIRMLKWLEDLFWSWVTDSWRSWRIRFDRVTDSSARRYEGAPCLAEPESCPTTLLSDSSSSHSILLFCFLFLFLLLSHSTLVFVRKNWQRECGLAFDARN